MQNADFEEGVVGINIPNWTRSSSVVDGVSYSVSDKNSYSGEKSLYIEDTRDDAGIGVLSDPIRIDSGKVYTLKTALYIDDGRTSVSLRFYDDNLVQLDTMSEHVMTGQKEWNEIIVSAQAPDNAAYVRVMLSCSRLWKTKAYYDTVRLFVQ